MPKKGFSDFLKISFSLLAGSMASHSVELSASEINDLLEESLPLSIRSWVDCLPDLSLDGMSKLLSIIDPLLKIAHVTYEIFSELGVA